nr:hypothetical protein [Tanacetum cinerariifolium]
MTLGYVFSLARIIEARFEAIAEKEQNIKEKANTTLSLSNLNFKIQENRVEYMRALNAAPLEVVFAGRVDEKCGKVLSATKIPEGGNSHLAYSPYHIEGKANFEGVGNVTHWAADVERRKRVKCYVQDSGRRKRVLCYVQGSERRKRKKSVGCGSERRDCALMGASVFTLYNLGHGSFAQGRIWDPRIKSAFHDNTLRARWL